MPRQMFVERYRFGEHKTIGVNAGGDRLLLQIGRCCRMGLE